MKIPVKIMKQDKMRCFNNGTATWKGKPLVEMTRCELYKAFNELAAHVAHKS